MRSQSPDRPGDPQMLRSPGPPGPPGQAWRDALDPALVRRLLRRAQRPGLCLPWQAQAILERHARMVGGLPLAELLQRRAEILADGRGSWAPIVYARPAAPPQPPATGPDAPSRSATSRPGGPPQSGATRPGGRPQSGATRPGGRPGASRPDAGRPAPARREAPRPVVRATPAPAPAPAAPPPAGPPLPAGSAASAPASPQALPWREPAAPPPAGPDPLAPGRSWGGPADAAAPALRVPDGPAAAPPGTTPSGTGTAGTAGGSQAPAAAVPPARPVVRPAARTSRPPGAPSLVLVTAAPPVPPGTPPRAGVRPGAAPPAGTSSSRPVVRADPGGNGNGAAVALRPAAGTGTWLADPTTLPVVRERVVRAPAPGGAWPPGAPAGLPPAAAMPTGLPVAAAVPAALPLAPAPARGTGTAAEVLAAGGQAVLQSPPAAAGTRPPIAAQPAARGREAGRGGPQARPQRVALARGEVDRIVDKVQRKLLHRLAIDAERRGTAR